MSSSIAAAQKRTIETLFAGFADLTPESIMAARHPSCTQQLLPASMNQPIRNYEDQFENTKMLKAVFGGFKMTTKSIFNDAENHKAAVHATSHSDSVIGPYDNEYVFLLEFTEDGTKIVKMEEMVDSAYVLGFLKRLRESGFGGVGHGSD